MVTLAGYSWDGLLISKFIAGYLGVTDVNTPYSDDKVEETALATAFDLTCRVWQVRTADFRQITE